ncbi:hypothetical protein [uncultured Croceitalea sp.]|uniref:hypothetical protein n=1 Tax=uncultured Croceitalea sp. TaxID=1798908 RepID=UPI00374E2505
MNWYLPITIIPGIGMLILSTATQMLSVSNEISRLLAKKCTAFEHEISDNKIKQLGLLTRASAFLYVATGCYVLSGIFGVAQPSDNAWGVPSIILYIGTILVFIALTFLIIYAFRAVAIRKMQFVNNHSSEK